MPHSVEEEPAEKGSLGRVYESTKTPEVLSFSANSQNQVSEPNSSRILDSEASPRSIYEDTKERWLFAIVVGVTGCLSSVTIPIYFPVLTVLAKDFNVSVSQINVTATIYSIFQGLSPLIWGTLSDNWGRRPVYFSCIVIYLVANICLAVSHRYSELLGLRILQALGGASTISLIGGTIGDISSRKNRGGLIGVGMGVSQLGNCFGPLIGSGIVDYFGTWRSLFWSLSVFAGIAFLFIFCFLPETNRRVVGNGRRPSPASPVYFMSRSLYAAVRSRLTGLPLSRRDPRADEEWLAPSQRLNWFRWVRIFFQVRVLLILFPTAVHYTNWYMVLTAQSTVLSEKYGFSLRDIGFSYLASGVGTFGVSLITGKILQVAYRKEVRFAPINIYKARLEYSFIASAVVSCATLVFGWSMHYMVSFYVPVIMTFFISAGAAYYLSATAAILVDAYPDDSAAGQSCNNLARCLMCAGGLAAVQSMMKTMGEGGCFTFTACFCLLSSACIWYVIHRYGPSRREQIRMKAGNLQANV